MKPRKRVFTEVYGSTVDVDPIAFAIFRVWHAGSDTEAKACWERMPPEMKDPWDRSVYAMFTKLGGKLVDP